MGVLGYPELFSFKTEFDFNNFYFTTVCSNSLYHGIDWVYTTADIVFSYDFRVWYFTFFDSIYDDSYDYFFNYFWIMNWNIDNLQLFYGVMLDLYSNITLFKTPYSDYWFKNLLSSKESSLIILYHPELCFINLNYLNNIYFEQLSSLFFSIFELSVSESFISPIILLPQLLLLFFFVLIFLNFYFSYFSNYSKDENIIDADYLAANLSVESEKEISSFDDMILGLVVLLYIFGWYFYIHCWSILSLMPELTLIFCLFPGLYFIIIGIPTFLIYDFGIYFLIYLKGVGSFPVMFIELVFDYIAVIIFYTRILVQGVRLVLMIFTYGSMHDLILLFTFNQKMFLGSESIWEDLNNVSITLDSFSYFFLFSLPGKFIYWIYEILHTFFVVTAQFVAFFAIVFWLFLFLYTMFVLEKQENYFTEKRIQRKNYFSSLYNLKN